MNLRTKPKSVKSDPVTASFMSNIDNFSGLPNLRNYCIVSLKDSGYAFMGEKSTGVLQLQNKLDGSNMNRDDQARYDHISRFVGALVEKVSIVTCYQISLILMIDKQKKEGININFDEYMFSEGQGEFSQMIPYAESLVRGIQDHQANKEVEDKLYGLI